MRKRRHHLTKAEEAALAADIALSRTLTTKELMRKYSASRSLVDAVKRKTPRIECSTLCTGPHAADKIS
jgi:hypothetical protein